jgi:multidrug efflux system outer membrane protein
MKRNLAIALAFTLVIAGCAKFSSVQKPAHELPEAWKDVPAQGQSAPGERWWTVFNDAMLERLVDEGLAGNRDLAIAAARVEEARAVLRIADSQRMPAVDVTAQRDRTRLSGRSSLPLPPGVPLENNNNRATVNISYEIDLWGRLSSASRAARAEMLATEAAGQTVRIALVSQIVQSYYSLLALDRQVAVTQRTLDLRAGDLALQGKRYEAGLISNFNLRQLEAEVAGARAQLPVLQQRRMAEEIALAILLGRSPKAIFEESVALAPDTALPLTIVPEGLPSELLLRRPDIVEAEQRLAAANARIAVARASMFPRISLTGFLGGESVSLNDLFSAPARIWQIAFGLAQPVFQGGQLQAEVDAGRAREQQAIAQYQKTVETAFGEVRGALSAQTRSQEAYFAESERAAALTDALRLARIRFDNGLSSQLEVIDAERNLLQAELNRSDALRSQRAAVADLARALGGGWNAAR